MIFIVLINIYVDFQIVRDRTTGISMGFGFVNFERNESAVNAVEKLNGLDLHGKRIKVKLPQ
jgi:RNA recognition motif-containing protein